MFAPILIDTTRPMKTRTEIEQQIAMLEEKLRNHRQFFSCKLSNFDVIEICTQIELLKWVLS
jgi:hypothetical protein